jgi:LAO/AO transport system kinase
MDLAKKILKGDIASASRLLSLIENSDPQAVSVLRNLYPHTGRSLVIGITGAAGVGKSTLISSMTSELRRRGRRVGILAMDPSSPFSGGALLGDRIRMREHFLDGGVFIRSVATRGHRGGVGRSLHAFLHVLEGMGCDLILVETIGVGQDEVQIASEVPLVVVVVTAEMGDEIQALKAGLLEVGDLFVVNKADRPGADTIAQGLREVLGEGCGILIASAERGEGIREIVDALFKRQEEMEGSGEWTKRQRVLGEGELKDLLGAALVERALEKIGPREWGNLVNGVVERRQDPYGVVERLVKTLLV